MKVLTIREWFAVILAAYVFVWGVIAFVLILVIG